MAGNKVRRIIVAAVGGLLLLGWAVVFLGQPGCVPRLLGTGGFVPRVVSTGPHPFAFDRPRLWSDVTDESQRAGGGALIQGPASDDGVWMTNVSVGAVAEGDPRPTGPITSPIDFAERVLPREKEMVKQSTAVIDGRPATDAVYEYERCGPHSAKPRCIQVRRRVVSFEDRGYYYILYYEVRDAEYDRYAEVFDRMVSSFRFLD